MIHQGLLCGIAGIRRQLCFRDSGSERAGYRSRVLKTRDTRGHSGEDLPHKLSHLLLLLVVIVVVMGVLLGKCVGARKATRDWESARVRDASA